MNFFKHFVFKLRVKIALFFVRLSVFFTPNELRPPLYADPPKFKKSLVEMATKPLPNKAIASTSNDAPFMPDSYLDRRPAGSRPDMMDPLWGALPNMKYPEKKIDVDTKSMLEFDKNKKDNK